jgi:hypothetical protein
MNADEYMNERLEDQINWYDKKSISNQKMYKRLRNTELTASTSITFIAGFIPIYTFMVVVVGLLGMIVAIIAGVLSLHNYHENWIEYRSICETLRHEKYMYLTKNGVYAVDDPYAVLVERVESIISHENVNWAKLHNSNEGGN